MIIGKKVIKSEEVVEIQEDIMEVTKLIRDDNKMLIELNKMQDFVENKLEMQSQLAQKVTQLIDMFRSEGVQIEQIFDNSKYANLQTLCGKSFNSENSSQLNRLIQKQPASFESIVNYLIANPKSIEEFDHIKGV